MANQIDIFYPEAKPRSIALNKKPEEIVGI